MSSTVKDTPRLEDVDDVDVKKEQSSHKPLAVRMIGFLLIVLNGVLIYCAVNTRVPLLKTEPEINAVEQDYQGLAVTSAVVILTAGIFIAYLVLRSFETLMKRLLKNKMPVNLRVRTVDLTMLILAVCAAFMPASSYAIAAVAPWPLLIVVPVAVLLSAQPRISHLKQALLPLSFSVVMMVLELALLGRWAAV